MPSMSSAMIGSSSMIETSRNLFRNLAARRRRSIGRLFGRPLENGRDLLNGEILDGDQ